MDIQNTIQNLREELNQHNHNYYVLDQPTISDYEFDLKLAQLQNLENQHPVITVYDSNNQVIQPLRIEALTSSSLDAQNILKEHFKIEKREYPDLIADMSLLIQDDLCLIRSNGDQELLAASVCSPSYWNVQSKIGKPLTAIHEPVSSLNEKIGDRISTFIRQSPLMRPFSRQNWLIHGDTNRFYLSEEELPKTNPSEWFIRSEKETLCRFHEDYSLFTINVLFQPLYLIHEHGEQKQN